MVKYDSLAIQPARNSRSRASASPRARREVAYRSLRPCPWWQSVLSPLVAGHTTAVFVHQQPPPLPGDTEQPARH